MYPTGIRVEAAEQVMICWLCIEWCTVIEMKMECCNLTPLLVADIYKWTEPASIRKGCEVAVKYDG
jgi:hypothetical protein